VPPTLHLEAQAAVVAEEEMMEMMEMMDLTHLEQFQ
jgi:hypothetical protein